MNLNNFDALIVLSNHMNSFGVLNSESKSRADKAAEIFKLSASKIITCGCAYREDSALKIAEAMKNYLINRHKISSMNIVIEPNSRDTVGDAVYTRKFLIDKLGFKKIAVITSSYHIARAKHIFHFVYDKNYEISLISCDLNKDINKEESERESLKKFKKTFYGIKHGDIDSIHKRMLKKHPLYLNSNI